MRIESAEYDGETYDAPCTVTVNYELVKNDFDEYELVRDGEVQLESTMPTKSP